MPAVNPEEPLQEPDVQGSPSSEQAPDQAPEEVPARVSFTSPPALMTAVVLSAVLMMFALTFCGMAALTVVVIPPDYLTEQLGEAVGWRDYVDIAWFTTSLGIMGGALGSNFDGSAKVRRATFSDRENERRDSDEEQPSGWREDEHEGGYEGSHEGSREAKKAAETEEK